MIYSDSISLGCMHDAYLLVGEDRICLYTNILNLNKKNLVNPTYTYNIYIYTYTNSWRYIYIYVCVCIPEALSLSLFFAQSSPSVSVVVISLDYALRPKQHVPRLHLANCPADCPVLAWGFCIEMVCAYMLISMSYESYIQCIICQIYLYIYIYVPP